MKTVPVYLPHRQFTKGRQGFMMKQGRNYRWLDVKKNGRELSQLIDYYHTFNRSEGKSPATVQWYDEVLRKFLNWLIQAEYLEENPLARMRALKVARTIIEPLITRSNCL